MVTFLCVYHLTKKFLFIRLLLKKNRRQTEKRIGKSLRLHLFSINFDKSKTHFLCSITCVKLYGATAIGISLCELYNSKRMNITSYRICHRAHTHTRTHSIKCVSIEDERVISFSRLPIPSCNQTHTGW